MDDAGGGAPATVGRKLDDVDLPEASLVDDDVDVGKEEIEIGAVVIDDLGTVLVDHVERSGADLDRPGEGGGVGGVTHVCSELRVNV